MNKYNRVGGGSLPQITLKSLDEIRPYANNPRKNDDAVEYVVNSIKEFGFKVPIIIDGSGEIVAGHTRYKAAKQLGMDEIPCIVADDLTDEQIKAFRLADNKVAEKAEWDFDLLGDELDDILNIDMEAFGFDFEIEEEEPEAVEDDYEVELPEEPKAKLGDIYQLGRHRLMCGDSTSITDVDKLLDGKNIDLICTDPPYGINADKGFSGAGGFNGNGKPIPRRQYDDEWDGFTPPKECFDMLLPLAEKAIIFGGNFFTDKLPQGNHWLVWNKHNTMPTFSDAELAWTNVQRNSVKIYDVQYNGLIGKEKERFHPTQKPVKLIVPIIKDYSNEDEVVLDVFGGSGTTLIACEQLNRNCFMMELDPKYVDVIIERWERFTGQKAVLLNDTPTMSKEFVDMLP